MLGLLEGIRGGASDARAAEQLQLQREQALRQQQMQDMQIQQMRQAMAREARKQADIDAAIAAWGDEGAAPPVGLAPPRNVNAPVGLEPPEPMAAPAGAAPGMPGAAPGMPGVAPGMPGAAPGMPGAAPTGGLSKFDRAVGTAALRSGNFDAAYKLRDRAKAESQDAARKAEFKRLMGLPNEELTAAFEPLNMSGEFKAMVEFDPKTKRFMITSKVDGLKSGTLSKEELVHSMMNVWEAGNGNFEKGLAGMLVGAQNRRALADKDYERSFGLAKGNADAFFKNADDKRAAERDAATVRYQNASLGLQRDRLNKDAARAAAADWKIIGTTADKKGLLYFNERTRQTEARPLPEGADADGLFRKLTGQGSSGMTAQQQLEMRAKLKTAGYDDVAIEQLVAGYDPAALMRQAAERKAAEKAKGNGKPTQVTAQPTPPAPRGPFPGLQQPAQPGLDLRALYERANPPRDPNYDPRALRPMPPGYGQPGYRLR